MTDVQDGCRLTDDVLTQAPRTPTIRAYFREASDRLAGADPGLTQLRTAVQSVLSIAVAAAGVYTFSRLTGALQLSPGSAPAAEVTAYNHALLIVSMLLAGMIAMMAGFTVADSTARGQVVSTLILPVPMAGSLALGLALGGYRILSLVYLIVLLAGAVYVRRWGPRGFASGLVAFNGGFLGFFLHAEIGLKDVGWLIADLLVGVAASLLVRFVVLRPDLERTLARMRRSWEARGRRLLVLSAAILQDASGPQLQEQLRRQVVRLNESTLMIDAQLVEAVPESAAVEAQRLFDAELALSNAARFAGALTAVGADATVRAVARAALTSVLGDGPALTGELRAVTPESDRVRVLANRLATSVEGFATARDELDAAVADRIEGRAPFAPAVALNSGWLPGSAPVSLAASTTPGRGGFLDRAAMPPYVRAAIQIAVAATLAVVVGDVVSGQRLYWAVLATFLAFMATTNSGEQVRKALFRVAGTAFGIVVGDLLVRLSGGQVWLSFGIVLIALFFGIYLIRVNYTFMVIGITVTMSQLYKQLGEFSWHLLLLRLGETAIGVGSVVVTVLVIVPLRPQRVLTAGVLLWFRALSQLVGDTLDRLVDAEPVLLRPAVRQVDAAYASLEATAVPLRRATFGRNSAQLAEIRTVSAAVRSYGRSLAVGAEALPPGALAFVHAAATQIRVSVAAIEHRIDTGEHGDYVRSAGLVELSWPADVEDKRLRSALRDLALLDGALARLAAALGMDVRDHDTAVTSA